MPGFFRRTKHVHPSPTLCIRTTSGYGEDAPMLTSSRPRTRTSRSSKTRVLSKPKPQPASRPPNTYQRLSLSDYVLDPAHFFAIQRAPTSDRPSTPVMPITPVNPLDGVTYDAILASTMKSFTVSEEATDFDPSSWAMAPPPNTPLGLTGASVAIMESMSNGT